MIEPLHMNLTIKDHPMHDVSILAMASLSKVNIYIFIAIALDESIFLDVFHFPMKNIVT